MYLTYVKILTGLKTIESGLRLFGPPPARVKFTFRGKGSPEISEAKPRGGSIEEDLKDAEPDGFVIYVEDSWAQLSKERVPIQGDSKRPSEMTPEERKEAGIAEMVIAEVYSADRKIRVMAGSVHKEGEFSPFKILGKGYVQIYGEPSAGEDPDDEPPSAA